jgi:hypothetical protein
MPRVRRPFFHVRRDCGISPQRPRPPDSRSRDLPPIHRCGGTWRSECSRPSGSTTALASTAGDATLVSHHILSARVSICIHVDDSACHEPRGGEVMSHEPLLSGIPHNDRLASILAIVHRMKYHAWPGRSEPIPTSRCRQSGDSSVDDGEDALPRLADERCKRLKVRRWCLTDGGCRKIEISSAAARSEVFHVRLD